MKKIITAASLLLSMNGLQAYNLGNGFSVEVDALYWSLTDTFPFSIEVDKTDVRSSETPFNFDRTIVDVKLNKEREVWEPGVRVGLGWNGCDCMDIRGVYTWFYSKDHHQAKTSFNFSLDGLMNLFSSQNGTVFPEDLNRTFNYNVADLEFGKTFQFCAFTFRPYAGVRAAWIDEKHRAIISGLSETFTLPPVEVDEPISVSFGDKMWGVGPRIGFDSAWGNLYGFDVLANASFSAVYGRNKHEIKVTVINASSNDVTIDENITDVTVHNNSYRLIPTFQMFIGLGWSTCFAPNYNMRIKAGWETNYWWDLGQVLVLDRALSLQGLTAGLEFTF